MDIKMKINSNAEEEQMDLKKMKKTDKKWMPSTTLLTLSKASVRKGTQNRVSVSPFYSNVTVKTKENNCPWI